MVIRMIDIHWTEQEELADTISLTVRLYIDGEAATHGFLAQRSPIHEKSTYQLALYIAVLRPELKPKS